MEIGDFNFMQTSSSSSYSSLASTSTGSASSSSSSSTISTFFEINDPFNEDYLTSNSYTFYGEAIIIALFFIIGSILNGPLLYVYCVSNQTRSIADKFLINLILADILSLLILHPTIILDLFLLERNEDIYFRNMTHIVANEIKNLSWILTTSINNNNNSDGLGGIGFISISSSANTSTFSLLTPPSLNYSTTTFDNHHNNNNNNNGTIYNTHNNNNVNNNNNIGFENEISSSYTIVTDIVEETWNWHCTFKKCLLSGIATASILSTLEIAMERYLAIVTPLHYHKFLTRYKVMMTSTGGGLIAIGSAILSALDPCEPVFPSCTRITITYTSTYWWPLYTLAHVTLFFIFPVLCMACIYIKIWLEARRQKAKISLQYKKPFFLQVTSSHPTDDNLKERPKFFLHPVILRFKFIDRFVTARMDRAARVAILTLMVTIICWSPYYFVQCAHSIRSILEQLKGHIRVKESWSHLETTVPLIAASLHPVLAPCFYGYRYTIIRDRVLILFHLDKWFPTIRERRSNSVSQHHHRAPSRCCNRPPHSSAISPTARTNRDFQTFTQHDGQHEHQILNDNNNIMKDQGDVEGQEHGRGFGEGAEADSTKSNNNYTIIQIEDSAVPTTTHHESDNLDTERTTFHDSEPHPYLFTIGVLDEEEEGAEGYHPHQQEIRSNHNSQIHKLYNERSYKKKYYSKHKIRNQNVLQGGRGEEERSRQQLCNNEFNCSSSDQLLINHHHHQCNNCIHEDQRERSSTNPMNCNKSYESCCCSRTNIIMNNNTKNSNQNTTSCSSTTTPSTSTSTSSSSTELNKILSISHQHCWEVWSNLIQTMIHCYTQRCSWESHRQSVSSNSSVVTLLSSRSISSEHLPTDTANNTKNTNNNFNDSNLKS